MEPVNMLDILILAAIAIALGWKLYSVLGSHAPDEQSQPNPFVTPSGEATADGVAGFAPDPAEANLSPDIGAGLAEIKRLDPHFRLGEFLEGAKQAFEMIVTAFKTGDRDTLKSLLSQEIYGVFEADIKKREDNDDLRKLIIEPPIEANVTGARSEGPHLFISLAFITRQRDDKNGALRLVEDLWTFSRDSRNSDPNWLLVETG